MALVARNRMGSRPSPTTLTSLKDGASIWLRLLSKWVTSMRRVRCRLTQRKSNAQGCYALDLGKMWTGIPAVGPEGSGLKTDRLDFDPAALVGEPFDVRALENIGATWPVLSEQGFPSVQASHVAFVAIRSACPRTESGRDSGTVAC